MHEEPTELSFSLVMHAQISLRPAPIFTFSDSVPLGLHLADCFSLMFCKKESINITLDEEDPKSPGEFEKYLEKPEFNLSYLNENFLLTEIFF